jgi:hypothetical protein
LHTLSYVIEGLVGVYPFMGERAYLDAACRAFDPLVTLRDRGRAAKFFLDAVPLQTRGVDKYGVPRLS